MQSCQSNQKDALTQIIINIFRVNTHLLEKGDGLVTPLGVTSACWRVLGAIALCDQAPTCQKIVEYMGITRQGAQKQINIALKDGLIASVLNPRHKRSPIYELTRLGRDSYKKAMKLQEIWANALAQGIALKDLQTTLDVLGKLDKLLQSTPLPK